ncbi:MAG: ribulose-phosphate 3-epimerase [Bacteroidetes bacterium]|nr:ribulose-phosphate 3-epimerase [Bacteroidota bacterium]
MAHLVAPSVLAADFTNLTESFRVINDSKADWVHVDVMDGRFVPNISFGMPVIKAMRKLTDKPFDVHLMIVEPDKYLEDFKKCGADILTVHLEACNHLHRTVQEIKSLGMKAGVSLNPHTPVSGLEDIIEDLDLVLLMSVNPGFGGQSYIQNTLSKARKLKQMIREHQASCLIEVDGGINLDNALDNINAGVDVLVAGSAIFKASDPVAAANELKSIRKDTLTV